ncbi:MAG: hypothetical protein ACRENE_35490, partial [Polyangiaceae bacterium]
MALRRAAEPLQPPGPPVDVQQEPSSGIDVTSQAPSMQRHGYQLVMVTAWQVVGRRGPRRRQDGKTSDQKESGKRPSGH